LLALHLRISTRSADLQVSTLDSGLKVGVTSSGLGGGKLPHFRKPVLPFVVNAIAI
jgi:hypothetical protein